MIYSIYKATNKINGKCYIGYDSKWPRRKHYHLQNARKGTGYAFHSAIRKYGEDNFEWEIIYQSKDQFHTLNVMETYFIEQYNSFVDAPKSNGYNMTMGGEGQKNVKMSAATRKKKSDALKGKPSPQSKWISTPHGEFFGLQACQRACDISASALGWYLRSVDHIDWYYKDNPKQQTEHVMVKGYSVEISTPHGIFSSVLTAATALNIPKSTVCERVASSLYPDWYRTGNVAKPGSKRISTPHGEFESAGEAARVLNISRSTIQAKLRSEKQTDWFIMK